MSRPHFLADHDLRDGIVSGVLRREPTLEFVRARELNAAKLADPELLQLAMDLGLILVSHDVNTMMQYAYVRIVAGQSFSGLIVVHQTDPVSRTIKDLLLIALTTEAEEWADRVTFLPV